MKSFLNELKGGDLRSLGNTNKVVTHIKTQSDFDELFSGLYSSDRKVVMRCADAVEKVTRDHPEYLKKYKEEIIKFSEKVENIEFKWHLAQLLPRLNLSLSESKKAWKVLKEWALDRKGSRIVRSISIQSLFDLFQKDKTLLNEYETVIKKLENESIPSINAKVRKVKRLREIYEKDKG